MGEPTILRNHKLRTLRALRMIEGRITGLSLQHIGNMLGLAKKTVSDELAWAERQGLLDNLEKQLLTDLVPAAMKTITAALALNDTATALEVMKGTGLFRKPAERIATNPAASQNEESLEVHVRRINRPSPTQITSTREASTLEGSPREAPALGPAPIEAELVPHREQARPQDTDQRVANANLPSESTLEHYLTQAGNGAGPSGD